MKISFCSSKLDPVSTALDLDSIEALKAEATPLPKDSAPLWSPCTFTDGSRLEARAAEVSCLVLDFDHGRPRLNTLKDLGIAHLWHTSASHTEDRPKWRLVVALAVPVPAKEWPKFWDSAVKALDLYECDKACKNVGRFYYLPPANAQWECYSGHPLPPSDFSDTPTDDLGKIKRLLLSAKNPEYVSPLRLALAGKSVASEGGRDVTVNGLGFYLGRSVVPHPASVDAVLQLVGNGLALPGVEPKSYWVDKFKTAFAKGREARQERTDESLKEQGLDSEWAKELQTASRLDGSVTVLSNTYNASVILTKCGLWRFRHNQLEDALEFSLKEQEYKRLNDADATVIANWLQQAYRVNLSRQQVYDQIVAVAEHYDPLKIYVEGLKWDGVNRADSFLQEYLGVEDTVQARLYGRKWLIAMMARALTPGCKVDNVLVLQGAQGLGKSFGFKYIAEPWFSDSKLVIGDKDSLLNSSRFWMHEIGELASFRRADLETIKSFVTSTTDSYRPPYGRAIVVRPRRCVYVGTTNKEEFLEDDTGLRRWWVVRTIRAIDFDKIRRDRDQLFAEAKELFLSGEHWWLEGAEQNALQAAASEEFSVSYADTPRASAIRQWWEVRPFEARPEYLTTAQVVLDIWNVPLERATHSMSVDASKMLRALGWQRYTPSEGGRRLRAFKAPLDWERLPQKVAGRVVDLKEVG